MKSLLRSTSMLAVLAASFGLVLGAGCRTPSTFGGGGCGAGGCGVAAQAAPTPTPSSNAYPRSYPVISQTARPPQSDFTGASSLGSGSR